MQIIVFSRQEIETFVFKEPCVVICIAYPNGRLHKVLPGGNVLAVHNTRFSDCDEDGNFTFPKTQPNIPVPMTRGHAIDIIEFVKKWREMVGIIYIACYGGISRSAGIGAGLCAVFGWDDTEIYRTKQPNAWCKTLIMREANKHAGD